MVGAAARILAGVVLGAVGFAALNLFGVWEHFAKPAPVPLLAILVIAGLLVLLLLRWRIAGAAALAAMFVALAVVAVVRDASSPAVIISANPAPANLLGYAGLSPAPVALAGALVAVTVTRLLGRRRR